MTATLEIGSTNMRKEIVDKALKGFATPLYKFKQAVSIETTNAWQNAYYREDRSSLTGPSFTSGAATSKSIKGLPRGAPFVKATPIWERVDTWLEKFGVEDNIFWEDVLTDNIDVQARVLYKLADAVVKQVDAEIWDVLSESQVATNIQNVLIANTKQWNGSSAAIIDDLMHAKQLIAEYDYPTDNLMCFISPKDHRSIVSWLAGAGAQFPSIGTDMAENGRVGKLAGIQLVMSNNVTASYALVVVPKICGTWKAAVPLSTDVTIDPFRSVRVRAVEMGVTQLTDPKAVVLIRDTQRTGYTP